MDERGWWARIAALVGAVVSFRVVVAMSTSVTVTVAVAGPMALEAYRVRHPEEVPVAAAERPEPPGRPRPTEPSPETTTTTTTTTTTAPDAVPVTAPGTVVTTTTIAAATTTAPAIGPDGLSAGVRPDRADAVVLEGAVVTGEVYLFAEIPGATAVRFWVDDATGSTTPARSDATAPFDLGDPLVDTTTLGVGEHTLLVEADTPSGPVRRRATFTVR